MRKYDYVWDVGSNKEPSPVLSDGLVKRYEKTLTFAVVFDDAVYPEDGLSVTELLKRTNPLYVIQTGLPEAMRFYLKTYKKKGHKGR